MFIRLFCLYCVLSCWMLSPVEAQNTVTAPSWRVALNEIKVKINALMEQNNQLTGEYKSLQQQQQQLWQDIEAQGRKNDDMREFLKMRNGKTDQQVRIDELSERVQLKKMQASARQLEANALQHQFDSLSRAVELKRLRLADLELHQNAVAQQAAQVPEPVAAPVPVVNKISSGDADLDGLRKTLEDQKAQEAVLENQLMRMTQAQAHPEIKVLLDKLEALNKQRSGLMQKASDRPSTVDRSRYYIMAQRKADLEAQIKTFEGRIDALRSTTAFDTSWPARKKKLVNLVVQADARNNKLRTQISTLREDIILLKDQTAGLERKVNFATRQNIPR